MLITLGSKNKKHFTAAYCPIDDEILISEHRHDFTTCSGGHFSVDGGNDYNKYSGNPENVIILYPEPLTKEV